MQKKKLFLHIPAINYTPKFILNLFLFILKTEKHQQGKGSILLLLYAAKISKFIHSSLGGTRQKVVRFFGSNFEETNCR